MGKYLKREITSIFLMLGNQCNMNCTYCLQHPLVNEPILTEIDPEIYDFLCETAYENEGHRINIKFYGGEPLLYFKNIKTVVGTLNKRNCVEFVYSIITIGKAMTDEMVKFFNENNISVTLSWDGNSVMETRGYDIFVDPVHLGRLLKINNLNLSGVISARAYPKELLESFQRISNKYYSIHGYHIGVNLDELFDTGIANKHLLKIDYERVTKEIKEILRTVDSYLSCKKSNSGNDCIKLFYVSSLIDRLNDFCIKTENNWNYRTVFCSNGLSKLNLDLQGNLYSCHNTSEKIGTIKDKFYKYLNKVLATDNTSIYIENCKGCRAFALCRGGCKFVNPKARKAGYCELKQAVFSPVIDYVEAIGNRCKEDTIC